VARKRLDDQSIVYSVCAGDQLELVARAVLDGSRGSVSEVLVWPGWRGRGIAMARYGFIEWETGNALTPSRIRSRLGKAFWADRSV
jgi:hypothetical protein